MIELCADLRWMLEEALKQLEAKDHHDDADAYKCLFIRELLLREEAPVEDVDTARHWVMY